MASGNESMGPSHKEVGTKTPWCALLRALKKKMLHRSHTAEQSVWAQIHVCRGVHRVTDLDKIPVRISKDEALTPLPVVGPLFISPLSFQFSRALLGARRFGLFCCVYSSFHERLELMMMMSWCLMSSDVIWHIRDKLWPMPKHGSINLYVHGNQKAR